MISVDMIEEKFNRKIKNLFNRESIAGQLT